MSHQPNFSTNEVERDFAAAMLAAGIETSEPIAADGALHRFRVSGDKAGSRNGWYVLHADGIPAGAFGCYKRDIRETWQANIGRALTAEERRANAERMEAIRQQREEDQQARHKTARSESAKLWKTARESVSVTHPYLERKRVKPYGIRQLKDDLLIPVCDVDGTLHGLQFIKPDGSKLFKTGTAKAGHFHAIGEPQAPGDVLAIAEGYATAATVHQLTGWATVAAFDAGNLLSVAQALAGKYPHARFVIAADNDHATEGNPGVSKARAAAAAVDAVVLAPQFEPTSTGSDWNDYAAEHGDEATRAALLAALEAATAQGEASPSSEPAAAPQAPAEPPPVDASPEGMRARFELVFGSRRVFDTATGIEMAWPAFVAVVGKPAADAWINGDHRTRLPTKNEEPPKAGKKARKPQPAGGADGRAGPRFQVTAKGLMWIGTNDEGDELPPWLIGPPIRVMARLRDEEESNWGKLIEFNDARGTLHRWGLPGRSLVKREEVMSELLRQGYDFAPTLPNQNKLLQYLGQPHDVPFARSVEKTGWHGRVYVLPESTIGEGDEPVYFQTETLRDNAYSARGDIGDWRCDVADLCRGNSRLLFAASAALASTLLPWADEDSGGFHFRGGSSSGKTTALRVAASVFGGSEYMRRWRATDNALEAVAAMHNDALLILDELAQVDPKVAGAAAYMLGNGEGKQRAFKGGTARPVLRWRLLFLSAGEISLSEHMRQDGKRAQAGQEARLAEIPADAGAGMGLFEQLHGYADGAAFSRAIVAGAARCHGTAGPTFIRAILPLLDDLPQRFTNARAEFCRRMLPPGSDGQAWRVAARFALVAAAGELATELGITGWERGEAQGAAETCFKAWIDQRGGPGNVEPMRMVAAVRHFLERHGSSRFEPWSADPDERTKWTTNNRAGFRLGGDSLLDDSKITYYVLPEVWREEVCAGFDHREVSRTLADFGALKVDKASRKYQRRERLPGLGMARCYVILPEVWAELDPQSGDTAEAAASDSAGAAGTAGTRQLSP